MLEHFLRHYPLRLLAGAEAVAGVMFIAIAVARSLMLMNDRVEEF